jgi:hypothetical protein
MWWRGLCTLTTWRATLVTVQAPGGVTHDRLKSRGQQKVAPVTPGSGLGIRLTTSSRKIMLLGNRGAMFSVRSMPRCYKQGELAVNELVRVDNCWGSDVVICCCQKLVAEARDNSGTQRKGKVHHWKLLPSNS